MLVNMVGIERLFPDARTPATRFDRHPRSSRLLDARVGNGSAIALAACIACAIARTPWLATAAVLGWAYPCAGYVFIALDQAKDPNSHNLLGIELIIYLGIGLLASFVGASIGTLILLPLKSRP
jgi:hypothetical protein